MKHIEDLQLPPETLQLITKGFLKGDKLKMLVNAITYFDKDVEKLEAKYKKDIEKRRLSKETRLSEGLYFLTTHGQGAKDYRREFINHSQQYILMNPVPLIDIGTIVKVYARCEAHLKFFQEAQHKGKNDMLIKELRYKFKTQQELITALISYIPKTRDAWKKDIQRFDKRNRPLKK